MRERLKRVVLKLGERLCVRFAPVFTVCSSVYSLRECALFAIESAIECDENCCRKRVVERTTAGGQFF
jgi:hypothetical protein